MAHRNEILFCKIAIVNKLLTRDQAAELLATVGSGDVGEALVERGYLSEPDRRAVVILRQQVLKQRGEVSPDGVSGIEKNLLLSKAHLPTIEAPGPNWKIIGGATAAGLCVIVTALIALSPGEDPLDQAGTTPPPEKRPGPSERAPRTPAELEKAVLALLDKLVDPARPDEEKVAARQALVAMKQSAEAALLKVAVGGKTVARRGEALTALAAIGFPEAIGPLLTALGTPDPTLIGAARRGLKSEALDRDRIAEQLLLRLEDPDRAGAREMIGLLAALNRTEESVVNKLRELAFLPEHRSAALKALVDLGPAGQVAVEAVKLELDIVRLADLFNGINALRLDKAYKQSYGELEKLLPPVTEPGRLKQAWQKSGIQTAASWEAYRADLFAQRQESLGLVLLGGRWETPEKVKAIRTAALKDRYREVSSLTEQAVQARQFEEALAALGKLAKPAVGTDFEFPVKQRLEGLKQMVFIKKAIEAYVNSAAPKVEHTFVGGVRSVEIVLANEAGLSVRYILDRTPRSETYPWPEIAWHDYGALGVRAISKTDPKAKAEAELALAVLCVEGAEVSLAKAALQRSRILDTDGLLISECDDVQDKLDQLQEVADQAAFDVRAAKIRKLVSWIEGAQKGGKLTRAVRYIEKVEVHKAQDDYMTLLADDPAQAKAIVANFKAIKARHFKANDYTLIRGRWYNPREGVLMKKAAGPWIKPMVKETRYYMILTDAGEPFLLELARRMDLIYEKYQKIFRYYKKPKEKLLIKVFKTQKQFMDYAKVPAGVGGYYNGKEVVAYKTPMVANPDYNIYGTMFHEAAHQFSELVFQKNFRTIPIWFTEGLAVYFEAGIVDDHRVRLGRIPKKRLADLQGLVKADRHIPFTALVRTPQRQFGYHHYNEAWSIIYYMMKHNPNSRRMLSQYVKLLRKGVNGDKAFEQVFKINFVAFEKQWKPWVLKLKAK